MTAPTHCQYRFHSSLVYEKEPFKHMYSAHDTLEEALKNVMAFLGIMVNANNEFEPFSTDDGRHLLAGKDYEVDYDSFLGREWYYDGQFHDDGENYPVMKTRADLTKMMQEAIENSGRYYAEGGALPPGSTYFEITPVAAEQGVVGQNIVAKMKE